MRTTAPPVLVGSYNHSTYVHTSFFYIYGAPFNQENITHRLITIGSAHSYIYTTHRLPHISY